MGNRIAPNRDSRYPLMKAMTARRFVDSLAVALGAAALAVSAQTPAADPRPRLAEAASRIQRGVPHQAIPLLEAAVQNRPHDAEAHLMLGTALSMIPRRNEAVQALLRALELRPDHAQSYAAAGMAFARMGERDAAFQVFERAVFLNPFLKDAHLNLALILAAKEEFQRAEEHMAQAISLEEDSGKRARLHFLNGKLYTERNRLEEAAREFERSIALDPGTGETYLALGVTRKKLLLEDEAYPMLQKSVELAPEDPTARYHLALELQRRGGLQAAVDHLFKAHELRPDDQSIVYNLTRALYKAGRRSESALYREKLARMIEAADKARENELDTARLHGDAVRLEQAGHYAAALDKYREVLRFEPLNGVARRNLALVLCRLDRWNEGMEELRAILREDPDDVETARALTIVWDQARLAGRGVSEKQDQGR